jgi:hypothetical protein
LRRMSRKQRNYPSPRPHSRQRKKRRNRSAINPPIFSTCRLQPAPCLPPRSRVGAQRSGPCRSDYRIRSYRFVSDVHPKSHSRMLLVLGQQLV